MALTAQVALLRGVNVGGRKAIAMADLRALAGKLGLETPRTLLQSGNLVFRSGLPGAELETLLEREVAARLGLETQVIVRTAAEWDAVIAANPHGEMAKRDPSHLVVMPLRTALAEAQLEALRAAVVSREVIEVVGRQLYITYPDGIGESKLTNAVIERRLGVSGTARNWNTVTKLAAMLADT